MGSRGSNTALRLLWSVAFKLDNPPPVSPTVFLSFEVGGYFTEGGLYKLSVLLISLLMCKNPGSPKAEGFTPALALGEHVLLMIFYLRL